MCAIYSTFSRMLFVWFISYLKSSFSPFFFGLHWLLSKGKTYRHCFGLLCLSSSLIAFNKHKLINVNTFRIWKNKINNDNKNQSQCHENVMTAENSPNYNGKIQKIKISSGIKYLTSFYRWTNRNCNGAENNPIHGEFHGVSWWWWWFPSCIFSRRSHKLSTELILKCTIFFFTFLLLLLFQIYMAISLLFTLSLFLCLFLSLASHTHKHFFYL